MLLVRYVLLRAEDGNELEATYANLSSSIYKFWTSDIILSYFKGTIVLCALLIFLLKS